MSDTPFAGFRPAAFTFLRGLKRHNTKAWFEAHRAEYETEVRAPMRALVAELDVLLGRLLPEVVADPRRSLFRIHRDVRFSKDKSPYKTHAALWCYHADAGHGVGQDAAHGGAGFYVHVEPGRCLVGAGIWMPPRPALAALRTRIADDPDGFGALLRAPAFRRRFGALDDEAVLTRVPRGFAADHPAAAWLRHQSFLVSRPVPDARVRSRALLRDLARDLEVARPFIRWLNAALGLAPRARR
jgi:uncharacterized protein (TIGR02453 family)